jgi:hypothetical protein
MIFFLTLYLYIQEPIDESAPSIGGAFWVIPCFVDWVNKFRHLTFAHSITKRTEEDQQRMVAELPFNKRIYIFISDVSGSD